MIYSMTGYAAATRDLPQGTLYLELRSVNHRYLDVQFRMPEEFRVLEPALREIMAGQLTRGKVDFRLGFTAAAPGAGGIQLDPEVLRQLSELQQSVRAVLPDAEGLRVVDVLRWPGILGQSMLPPDRMREVCVEMVQHALSELAATRSREGEKLKALLEERVTRMQALASEVAPRIPGLIAAFEEKLGIRMREALGSTDDERVRQEITLFASKIDVDEELSRLRTHLAEVLRVLAKGGTVGKRLDFLMQELNREANTLGSKSVDTEVSRVSMELKVLIEQMREQIQNIE